MKKRIKPKYPYFPIDEKDSIINKIKTLVLQTLDSKITEQTMYINRLKQEYGNSD